MKKLVKKSMILFLVFLLLVPLDLISRKRKKGAELVVYKIDGREVRGELLQVKMNSLLLMESPTTTGITININEVRKIKITRKAKFWNGVGIGFGISLFYFGYWALDHLKEEGEGGNVMAALYLTAMYTAIYGSVPILISGIFGSFAGIDRTFKIEGKKKYEVDDILKELNLMARFKTIDSPPAPRKKINVFGNLGLATWEFDGMFFDLGLEMQLYRHIYGQFFYDYYQKPFSWWAGKGNFAYGFNLYVVYKLLRFNKLNLFIKGGIHYSTYQLSGSSSGITFKNTYFGIGTGAGIEVSLSNKLALVLGVTGKHGELGEIYHWFKYYCGLSYCLNK